jgi:hypothetical protein
MIALSVAEGATQSADLDLQICIFHDHSGPSSGDQLLLAHHLAGPFDQRGQDAKGAAAEPHRRVAFEQEALHGNEPERAKRNRAYVHGTPQHLFFYRILLDWASDCPAPPWEALDCLWIFGGRTTQESRGRGCRDGRSNRMPSQTGAPSTRSTAHWRSLPRFTASRGI